MGRFREQLRAGRIHMISLEIRGPRSKRAQQAFINALLALRDRHKITIRGLVPVRAPAAPKPGPASRPKGRATPAQKRGKASAPKRQATATRKSRAATMPKRRKGPRKS